MRAFFSRPGVQRAALYAALALVSTALFAAHVHGEFVWDDIPYAHECKMLHTGDGWWRLFVSETVEIAEGKRQDRYHPIPMFSLWLQMRFSDAIEWLRAGNIAIHVVNVALFARILERVGLQRSTVLFTALAFAVHPLVTEPVMLITGRHDSVAVAFMLAALVVGALHPHGRSPLRVALTGLLVLAACISKESAAAAPLVFCVAAWLTDRGSPDARARGSVPPAIAMAAPFAGVAFTLLIRRALDIRSSNGAMHSHLPDHVRNLGTILAGYARYVVTFSQGPTTRLYAPLGLAAALVVLVATGTIIVGMLVRVVRGARARGWSWADRVLLGLAWFVLVLGPYVIAVPVTGRWGNRYGYLACMGLLLAFASVFEVSIVRLRKELRATLALVMVALLSFGALGTSIGAGHWRDSLSLFYEDVEQEPRNGYALFNLGVAVQRKRGCEAALEIFLRAAEHDPKNPLLMGPTSMCLSQLGRLVEAEKYAERGVNLHPREIAAIALLADLRLRLGRLEEAAAVVRYGLDLYPDSEELQRAAISIRSAMAVSPLSDD